MPYYGCQPRTMKVHILVVATWVLAGCEAAVPPAKMASLGGLTPDTKALVVLSADMAPKHPTWIQRVRGTGSYATLRLEGSCRSTGMVWASTAPRASTPYPSTSRTWTCTLTGTPNLSSLDGALTVEGVYAQKVAKAATGVLN